ncbi:nitroreductase [Alloactinosynnema sp. L-07]|uniref:nitroreductase family protein n=1 Tax=Alloactinosynnema sp. L-07 TaxID=1653480 RepID=UPI00065EF407|nr:nitroreductase family protein [Alloactinosynnema sp. L-07]CRK58477.1 nitroreductase [Alloactinosynnema sp. L-07]
MTFDEFWTETSLTTLTQRAFADRLADHRAAPRTLDPFVLPAPPVALHRPRDRLARLFGLRRSEREFGRGPLSNRDLGSVLSALAEPEPGRRSYPSAGGLNAVRAYPILVDADHELTGRVTRYDPAGHSLQDLTECPQWSELSRLIGTVGDVPQLVIVLVLDDQEQFTKYGPRAGRFGLVEAGAAAQSLALRVAERGLAGYLLGGGADRELLGLLGLTSDRVRVATTYVCGRKANRGRVFTRRSPILEVT